MMTHDALANPLVPHQSVYHRTQKVGHAAVLEINRLLEKINTLLYQIKGPLTHPAALHRTNVRFSSYLRIILITISIDHKNRALYTILSCLIHGLVRIHKQSISIAYEREVSSVQNQELLN
jgi:hypothetical protein